MSRRRKLLVVAILVGATTLYALWRASDWGARLVEQLLAGYFHRPVQVAALGLDASRMEVVLHGLRIGGVTPDAEPFIEAPLVRIRPNLAPFRGNRIVLSRVRIEGLRLRINAFPDPPAGPGGDDIPKLGGPRRGGIQIGIEQAGAGGRRVHPRARPGPARDRPARLPRPTGGPPRGRAGGALLVPARLAEARLGAPPIPVGTEIDMVFHRGVLTVAGARLRAENTNVTYHGRLRFSGRPQGQLQLEGAIDLAVLERHIFRSGLGFAGAAHWNGLLSIDGSRLRIEGRMSGTNGRFMGVAVPRFAGALAYDGPNGVVIKDAGRLGARRLRAARDRRAALVEPPSDPDPRLAARRRRRGPAADDLRLGRAADRHRGDGHARRELAARQGARDQRPHRGRPGRAGRRTLRGGGRFDWSAIAGLQSYERLELQGSGLRGRVTGEVDAAENARLAIDGQTADLAASDAVLVQVRRALGSPEAQPAGFTGAGSFRGRWRGTLAWPVFEGRFSGTRVGYVGVDWGRAEWSGSFDTAAEAITSRSLVLRKDGGEIWWDGRNEIGWLGLRDAMRRPAAARRMARRGRRPLHGVARRRDGASERGGERAGPAQRSRGRGADRRAATDATSRCPSSRRASTRAGTRGSPRSSRASSRSAAAA